MPRCCSYPLKTTAFIPVLNADWDDAVWASAKTIEVSHFRPESSDHRPLTRVKMLASAAGLHGIFHVQDRFVRCARTGYFDEVWKDSCVEFFVQPKADKGYFNFEFNCGGAFLCNYITDPTRTPEGFKAATKVPWDLGATIQCRSSLPSRIDPEIGEAIDWTLQFFLPVSLLDHYVGKCTIAPGERWRGNFFKCAEDVSHPHWAAWCPVDEFNFHLPRCFGKIEFQS